MSKLKLCTKCYMEYDPFGHTNTCFGCWREIVADRYYATCGECLTTSDTRTRRNAARRANRLFQLMARLKAVL